MGGEWGENKKANGAECKQLIKSNLIDLDNRYKGAALTTSLWMWKYIKGKLSPHNGTLSVPRQAGGQALPVIAGATFRLKHPEAEAAEGAGTVTPMGKQLEQWTMLTEVGEHVRQPLSLGSSLAWSRALRFSSRIKSYSQHMENRAILPKGGWEGMKLEALASSGALLSPYLFYLISVFFPKCLWLQVPSSLFPLPTTCSGSLSCHTWITTTQGGQTMTCGPNPTCKQRRVLHF